MSLPTLCAFPPIQFPLKSKKLQHVFQDDEALEGNSGEKGFLPIRGSGKSLLPEQPAFQPPNPQNPSGSFARGKDLAGARPRTGLGTG